MEEEADILEDGEVNNNVLIFSLQKYSKCYNILSLMNRQAYPRFNSVSLSLSCVIIGRG